MQLGSSHGHPPEIAASFIEDFLRREAYPDAIVSAVRPLGREVQEQLKSYGYGRPLRVTFHTGGKTRDLVLHTMLPDPFGHDRRSDRVAAIALAADTFGDIPRHVPSLWSGLIDANGRLASTPCGEPFLLTAYEEGELYAHDLTRIAELSAPTAGDLARTAALARFLAELHAEPLEGEAPRAAYVRSLRDVVGHGECIFGLTDSYPGTDAVGTPARLERLEHGAIAWRWRLKRSSHRARRVHGDFHPFNILFRAGEDFSLLDASRGGIGDPADDVTCLAINYLFFALTRGDHRFQGPMRALWDRFFGVYLDASRDREILSVTAPFFAWRTLVLASPIWYPNVEASVRDRMFLFAERLLEGATFDPAAITDLIR